MSERITRAWGDYIRVFLNCPARKGCIMELQVPKADWFDSKYDEYRLHDKETEKRLYGIN